MDTERFKAIRILAETATPAELPELAGALAEAGAIVAQRLFAGVRLPVAHSSWPDLIDANAMAAQLSIKPSWLLEQARQGKVPHVRLGKYVRFDAGAVVEWMRRK